MAEQAGQMSDPEKLAQQSIAMSAPLSSVFCDLSGKVAIVTGGATGLGFNVAARLAEAGAKVMIASRNQMRGDAAVAALTEKGYEAAFCATDVSSVESCYALVDETVKTFGNVDILVTSAAGWDEQAYLDVTEATYDRVLDVDLKGSFFMGQAVARNMVANKTKGKIVFISSAAHLGEGPRCVGMNTYYQAAKAGVCALTTGAAAELKQYGINVNCVAPGGMLSHGVFFEGRDNGGAYGPEYAAFKQEVMGWPSEKVPLAFNPDQVALMVFALCTPASDFMQGATVDVNGGAMLNAQLKPFSTAVEGCIPGPQA